MDNVYLYRGNYFLWLGITTFREKLITLHIVSQKLVEFNQSYEFIQILFKKLAKKATAATIIFTFLLPKCFLIL